MNLGQLTSMTNCETCHMPLEIFANKSEVICKYCGRKNNLKIKQLWDSDNIKISKNPIYKLKLNTDKIKTIDDIKRILEFIDIEVTIKDGVINERFEKVKDLFEWG
ncbi:MAG: hypothetical protein KHZ90_08185 [Veillonella parvula]|uniref:Uncharacterized protein n=1 Tax=Veillonella parvula TaxID=29466 RepID=A0A943ABF7_VEIPA|nr:hypothetical protein [Veillonella parvula]MBS4893738.1 hypothetical protein [Veillonella parvula]